MNRIRSGLIVASLSAAAFHAGAQQASVGHIDGYYIPIADIEVSPGSVTFKDDGDGFGVKGRVHFADQMFISGEYQSVGYDSNIDLDQLRVGLGLLSPLGANTNLVGNVEYINADLDVGPGSDSESGFGVHGGIAPRLSPAFVLTGTVGYVSIDDLDGPEFLIGARYLANRNISVFADYRMTRLSDRGVDLDLDDLRIVVSGGADIGEVGVGDMAAPFGDPDRENDRRVGLGVGRPTEPVGGDLLG